MRIRLIIFSILAGCLALFLIAAGGAWWATQYVPEAYAHALELDGEELVKAGREMEHRVTSLYSDARLRSEWQALFTDEQINGWLAVDLKEKHGRVLPRGVEDPRVVITKDKVMVAFRADQGGVKTVFSIDVESYLAQPNVIAFRLRRARAGALPLPMAWVLDEVTQAADRLNVSLTWTQIEDDPVALVTIRPPEDERGRMVWLESLEVQDGAIYLAGHTQGDTIAEGESPSKMAKRAKPAEKK